MYTVNNEYVFHGLRPSINRTIDTLIQYGRIVIDSRVTLVSMVLSMIGRTRVLYCPCFDSLFAAWLSRLLFSGAGLCRREVSRGFLGSNCCSLTTVLC